MSNPIIISPILKIFWDEIEISHARSGGPGGQNVNKVNSKVFLRWHLLKNNQLTDEMREKIREKCSTYLTNQDEILISSVKFRSQHRNLEDCVEKLIQLIQKSLVTKKKRGKTRIPTKVKERRLENKKQNSMKKKLRQKVRGYHD